MQFYLRSLLVLLALACAGPTSASELTHHMLPSAALKRDLSYLLYLPDEYDAGQRYPVLYLLHGAGSDENAWVSGAHIKERVDKLIATGIIPPTIVVVPSCPTCWWVDGAKDKAETAFWSELVPYVDRTYRTLAGKDGRLIAGFSAGGFGAVRFAMKYPDRVAAVAALSPAIYSDAPPEGSAALSQPPFLGADGKFSKARWAAANYPHLSQGYFAQRSRVPFYLVSGDGDELGITFETALLFKTLFEKQPKLVELRVVDGEHDWKVWSSTLDDALRYIYRFVPREHAASARRDQLIMLPAP